MSALPVPHPRAGIPLPTHPASRTSGMYDRHWREAPGKGGNACFGAQKSKASPTAGCLLYLWGAVTPENLSTVGVGAIEPEIHRLGTGRLSQHPGKRSPLQGGGGGSPEDAAQGGERTATIRSRFNFWQDWRPERGCPSGPPDREPGPPPPGCGTWAGGRIRHNPRTSRRNRRR